LGKPYIESAVWWRPGLVWVWGRESGAWLDCCLCCCDSEEDTQKREKILEFHFLVFGLRLLFWRFYRRIAICSERKECGIRLKEKTFDFYDRKMEINFDGSKCLQLGHSRVVFDFISLQVCAFDSVNLNSEE
jgi:hypothetical protein